MALMASTMLPDPAGPGLFPPLQVSTIIAWVCESLYVPTVPTVPQWVVPAPVVRVVDISFATSLVSLGEPPAFPAATVFPTPKPAEPRRGRRLHLPSLLDFLKPRLNVPISRSTLWRILDQHALKPWRFRYWIFPRDPKFLEKAGPVLDLYAGFWQGQPLGVDEFVVSLDEKTSIQARIRRHPTVPASPGHPALIEFEYERGGALQYLAGWDVHRGVLIGRCEPRTGIKPFDRLVDQIMTQEPYRSARRVFMIVDNGSSHRGQASIKRLQKRYPNLVLVHLPTHASWLNQIEIVFSILQRLVLTANDFSSLDEVAQATLKFQDEYTQKARPFAWKFTKVDLEKLLDKLRQFPFPAPKPRKKRKTKKAQVNL
jgi:transposase